MNLTLLLKVWERESAVYFIWKLGATKSRLLGDNLLKSYVNSRKTKSEHSDLASINKYMTYLDGGQLLNCTLVILPTIW